MAVTIEFDGLVISHDGESTPPITLDAGPGDKLAVVCGRDMYDRLLLGLLMFLEGDYTGTARFEGRDFSSYGDDEIPDIRRRIGTISLHLPMISNLKLIENVYLQTFYRRNGNEQHVFDEALGILRTLGIDGKYNVLPAFLNPFERKLGLLARTMLSDPEIVYYGNVMGDLDRDKRGFLVDQVNRFHEAREGRISILTLRSINDIDDIKTLNCTKILHL